MDLYPFRSSQESKLNSSAQKRKEKSSKLISEMKRLNMKSVNPIHMNRQTTSSYINSKAWKDFQNKNK